MLVLFKLLGSLALLMFGMKSMSEALQKMAGPRGNDHQPFHWYAYGYAGDSICSVIYCYDSDDCFVCQCRIADAGASHLSDYGCEHWNDAYGMDHVCRYVV